MILLIMVKNKHIAKCKEMVIMTIEELYLLNYEELIDYVLQLQIDIDMLEYKLGIIKKRETEKINNEYENNRNMVATIFKEVIKNEV